MLLIIWLAAIGATRVDLLGGAGPLVLTPFLVLSPIVLAAEAWRLAQEGWELRLPPGAAGYLLAVSALMALLLVSTFLAFDLATSGRRFALLFVQVYFVFLVGMAVANRPNPGAILLGGAYAGLGLSFAMNLGQLAVWLRESLWPGALGRFVDLEPGVYFGILPRFTGVSHDPNLGGLLLVFYLALILVLAPASRLRNAFITLALLAIALTISRSALLAVLALGGLTLLERYHVRLTAGGVGAVAGIAGIVTALYLLVPGSLDPAVDLAEIVAHRFTPEEGSTTEHGLLLARGWEVGTENVKQALVGIGYGNAWVRVQDIFPGNEYGNFHSLFVTMFAEAGALAALLAIGIFAHLLMHGGPYRPLVAAMIAYNLFQQAHTDPVLWLGLLLAWVGIGVAAPEPDGVAPPEPGGLAERAGSPEPGPRMSGVTS